MNSQLTNTNSRIDPTLVAARNTLCEVLDILSDHRQGIIVVGSQGVHERTKQLPITSTATKDTDIAFIPKLIGAEPHIEDENA